MKFTAIFASALLVTACAVTSNTPSDFVVENSVIKTRIHDRNKNLDLEYQFATNMEFVTTTRRIGSERAKRCDGFARQYVATPAWLDVCSDALAESDISRQNRLATMFNRGLIYMNLGQLNEARASFYALVSEAPDFGDPYLALGTLEANADNYELAKDFAKKAMARKVENPDRVYVLIGWVAENEFDFPAARTAYKSALALNPLSSSTRRKLDRLNRLWPEEPSR